MKLEELNENKYKKIPFLFDPNRKVAIINESEFANMIFKKVKFSKKFISLKSLVSSEYICFEKELNSFEEELKKTLLKNWNYEIKEVFVFKKNKDKKIKMSPKSEDVINKYVQINAKIRNQIIWLIGDSKKYKIITYSNADDFKEKVRKIWNAS